MKQIIPQEHLPRAAGILLPISSIPSKYGIGTFGKASYDFVDFLKKASQKYWQVLPIGPTSYGDSPYQSFSAFAGNPYFIDLEILYEEGLLSQSEIQQYQWSESENCVDYSRIYQYRFKLLEKAFHSGFVKTDSHYQEFCKENEFWLEDYSFYMSLKYHFEQKSWYEWPEDIKMRSPQSIKKYKELLNEKIDFWKFCQFQFFKQWHHLKEYAHKNGVEIIGDIPIYVALDSADVWVNGGLFQLDENKAPTHVAGVPPDAFSSTGQLWGNPLYNWQAMEKDDFVWWKQRMSFSAKLYDLIRIDHFIGIVRYYSIPANETTAINGEWKIGPGEKLISAISQVVGNTRIIAEDLGVLVPEVTELRKKAGYPGMKILEFAFDGSPTNDNLPGFYNKNMVVYGGTHDNETLAGFFAAKKPEELRYAMDYLHTRHRSELRWAVIRAGYASCANTAIFQMQDFLGLGNEARMNFPSTIGGNWCWRLTPGQLTDQLARRISKLSYIYGRKSQK